MGRILRTGWSPGIFAPWWNISDACFFDLGKKLAMFPSKTKVGAFGVGVLPLDPGLQGGHVGSAPDHGGRTPQLPGDLGDDEAPEHLPAEQDADSDQVRALEPTQLDPHEVPDR